MYLDYKNVLVFYSHLAEYHHFDKTNLNQRAGITHADKG